MTDELKRKYTSHNETGLIYETLQLYHPNFSVSSQKFPSKTLLPSKSNFPGKADYSLNSHYIVKDIVEHTFNLDDGTPQIFGAYPFSVQLPEVGNDQQDMNIVLDNVSLELISSLELAIENPEIPIMCVYRVYIDGSDDSQNTPLVLWLTNISVSSKSVTATATRADLFARTFPHGNTTLYDSRFAGLYI